MKIRRKEKNKKGISLIVLVITIIVMVILSVTAITFTTSTINQATKSKFYEEMTQLNEQKELAKVMIKLDEATGNITETSFYSRNITPSELEQLDETLKAEIVYVRLSFDEGEPLKTSKIWKENMYNCQNLFNVEDNRIGLSKDIRFITSSISSSGKENTYLCDDVSNVCFKLQSTKLGKHTVHSLEYAKLVVDGVNAKGVGIVDFSAGVMTSSDGTKVYEPDLNNFSYTTEVVYYSPDFTKEYTMKIQDFIDAGKPSTKTINGEVYTFANYVASGGTEKQVWANIRTMSNGLTAYWVWIPRFAYKLDSSTNKADIIFIDANNKPLDTVKYGAELSSDYTVHEAFKQDDAKQLKGIWFSKYESKAIETVPVDKSEPMAPDLSNFNTSATTIIYYDEKGENPIERPYSASPAQTIEENGKTYYWYNYTNKIWANIKTTANDLEAWWVWIPRFAYKLESGTTQVIFIDTDDKPLDTTTYGTTLPNGYTVHEAFKQDEDKQLKGIWFSKYEPKPIETVPVDKHEPETPNLAGFNTTETTIIYYDEKGENPVERPYSANPPQTIEENGKTYYWYNYINKIWANVKTTANDLEAWWVWIPRFAYKLESGTTKVIFIDTDDKPLDTTTYGTSLPDGYVVHEAFKQDDTKQLKGIWFSKYEPKPITVTIPQEDETN